MRDPVVLLPHGLAAVYITHDGTPAPQTLLCEWCGEEDTPTHFHIRPHAAAGYTDKVPADWADGDPQ